MPGDNGEVMREADCNRRIPLTYRVAHEKPARRLVEQRGRRSRNL